MYLFYHLSIVIFTIDLIITAKILTFSATLFDIPTITNDSITLNVELSNCTLPCSCHVQTNKTDNFIPVKFNSDTEKGYVVINNLETYTMYSFDLNCSEVNKIKTYTRRTDVSRPSPPKQIQITLNKQHVRFIWEPPNLPHGPIDDYRITVDGNEMKPYLNNTELSYEIKQDHVFGITHTMNVRACNIDTQQRVLCSDAKDIEYLFVQNENSNSTTIPPIQSTCLCQIPLLIIYIIQFLVVIL